MLSTKRSNLPPVALLSSTDAGMLWGPHDKGEILDEFNCDLLSELCNMQTGIIEPKDKVVNKPIIEEIFKTFFEIFLILYTQYIYIILIILIVNYSL